MYVLRTYDVRSGNSNAIINILIPHQGITPKPKQSSGKRRWYCMHLFVAPGSSTLSSCLHFSYSLCPQHGIIEKDSQLATATTEKLQRLTSFDTRMMIRTILRRAVATGLAWWLATSACNCVMALQPVLSRSDFFISTLIFPWNFLPSPSNEAQVTLPLRFLPIGGGWALRITLADRRSSSSRDVSYFAIVDTGSPFLTCPPSLSASTTISKPTQYPRTLEQYGEETGGMTWRNAYGVSLALGLLEHSNMVMGIPFTSTAAATTSMIMTDPIFCGLIVRDDNRPTFLQQFGYPNFQMNFVAPSSLVLSKKSLIAKDDPDSVPLFDLTPYGKDLYHYGVLAETLEFRIIQTNSTTTLGNNNNNNKTERILQIPTSTLQRPVVAVLDTGLTGCILSDSLFQEVFGVSSNHHHHHHRRRHNVDLQGATVTVRRDRDGTTTSKQLRLVSLDAYWHWSSFRLPWFPDETTHPHIIALGTTFWANTQSLTIDSIHQLAKISTTNDAL